MSNPTELPDLDKLEALAKAAQISILRMGMNGRPNDYFALMNAMSPEAVLALIALARRAQPEGEAPQADEDVLRFLKQHDAPDAVVRKFIELAAEAAVYEQIRAAQHAEISNQDIEKLADKHDLRANISNNNYDAEITFARDVLTLRAQHAESGAQADDERALFERHAKQKRLSTARVENGLYFEQYTRDAWEAWQGRAALAAQSQGAQAVPDGWSIHRHDRGVTVTDGCSIRAVNEEDEPTLYRFCTALAAKAEAPRTDLSKRIRAAATADVTMAQAKLLIGAAEEIERAQQAAAPGALDLLNADELAALRRFDETCQDGEGYDVPKTMMQRLAAIGVVRRTSGSYYETTDFGMRVLDQPAPSAPGTPEAPKGGA